MEASATALGMKASMKLNQDGPSFKVEQNVPIEQKIGQLGLR
jgi:hypothetical protein